MKHCYTLLLLMWCSLAGAQTDFRFADSTAQWSVLTTQHCIIQPCASYQTDICTVEKDTVLSGITYQKIVQHNQPYFIRKDTSNIVWLLVNTDTADHKLYDFSVQQGDSLILSFYWQNVNVDCMVNAVDSVFMGKWRKRVFVTYDYSVGFPLDDIWIEGIGSLKNNFLLPVDGTFVIDGDIQLLCFSENGITLYQDTTYFKSCYVDTTIWMGVKDMGEDSFKVFVNSDNSISVQSELPYKAAGSFLLYDLTGRLILQKELTEQTTRIDLSGVAQGVYVYSIQSKGPKIKTGKLMIE